MAEVNLGDHEACTHNTDATIPEVEWREAVESGSFRLPPPLPPSPYPGFAQYVRTIEKKGEALPALLTRSDGATILYAGKFNTVFAEPGMVKTWIGIKAALAA